MTRLQLFDKIKEKQSFLSVGLDPDIEKFPKHLRGSSDNIFEFNKAIIDATKEFAVAYKLNTAFFEAHGSKGWEALEQTVDYLPDDVFKIADAKRADIGNTSKQYAKAFFETMDFDAVTVSPYMGEDSVKPFLEFENKWVIILAATSNSGFLDFQDLMIENTSEHLYETVMRRTATWGSRQNTMFVVGATRTEKLITIRSNYPEHFFLIPGVGAQGGSLDLVYRYGRNRKVGLLINSSRNIIFAGDGPDFAEKAREAASDLQKQMAGNLAKNPN